MSLAGCLIIKIAQVCEYWFNYIILKYGNTKTQ